MDDKGRAFIKDIFGNHFNWMKNYFLFQLEGKISSEKYKRERVKACCWILTPKFSVDQGKCNLHLVRWRVHFLLKTLLPSLTRWNTSLNQTWNKWFLWNIFSSNQAWNDGILRKWVDDESIHSGGIFSFEGFSCPRKVVKHVLKKK